jgi:hypothetical protein
VNIAAGLGAESGGGFFETLVSKSRDSLYLIDSTIVKAYRAASGAKGAAKSGDRHRPWRALHENPRHR